MLPFLFFWNIFLIHEYISKRINKKGDFTYMKNKLMSIALVISGIMGLVITGLLVAFIEVLKTL